jgi:predicted nucleic acid-binding protein
MILVDSSIWIDHLLKRDDGLFFLLDRDRVLGHPFVTGEVALGHLRQRALILSQFERLPAAPIASTDEVLSLIEAQSLFGVGLGYVDAHLLAATLMSGDATLWTRDKRLRSVAARLGVAADLA